MTTRNLQHLPFILTPKMVCCSLCGRDFDALDRDDTCPTEFKAVQRLSVRETQVADLIQQAKSNKEIAYELGLTTGTVKEYLFHIFRKLGVSNRTELALWKRDSTARAAFSA
jgi:DNA-binding NarL/FixJ family response regulator